MTMQPEVYFLKYAFPCARNKVDIYKTMTEEEYSRAKQAFEAGTPLPRDFLERVWAQAVEGLKQITPDYWNIETMREYYWHRHNDSMQLSVKTPELCKIRKATLEKKIENSPIPNAFRADLGEGRKRVVFTAYPGAKEGDKTMVHYAYAVEKVE